MNEQLIVKNFGPIKDATVDFKRVTVFIGPTGGGKSTLAKLAAIFREVKELGHPESNDNFFSHYSIGRFRVENTNIIWAIGDLEMSLNNQWSLSFNKKLSQQLIEVSSSFVTASSKALKLDLPDNMQDDVKKFSIDLRNKVLKEIANKGAALAMDNLLRKSIPHYVPSERAFIPSIEYSWAGLMRDDIGLPKLLLEFANIFSLSKKDISELSIPFLNVKYLHINGRDFVQIPGREEPLMLWEAASGIQSVTPMLVLLEHLSRNTEQAQSFIIEEPELNLYPTAQQGLIDWLVEKCTKGENDLTITTHSPYILSHLNLLLYAYHVGNKDEEKRQKVAAIIPEKYWVNPDEFAAYYVNGSEGAGGIRSLLDPETKLISQNELDTVSGIQADKFDQLLDINRGF